MGCICGVITSQVGSKNSHSFFRSKPGVKKSASNNWAVAMDASNFLKL